MNRDELLALHDQLCKEARTIMEAKNHDYAGPGDDAFSNFRACEQVGLCSARIGLLCRMLDKLKRLVTFAKTGELNLAQQYRVIRALFTPATAATLKSPIQSNPILRSLSGVEDLMHVHLKSPTPEEPDCEDYNHTLIYVKGQWLVIPGLYGSPRRTYRLTIEEALNYHRKVFAALKANNWLGWLRFLRWYLRWRKTVSTRP